MSSKSEMFCEVCERKTKNVSGTEVDDKGKITGWIDCSVCHFRKFPKKQ